jgi:tRNA G26 N,N-dimethylase Trm1
MEDMAWKKDETPYIVFACRKCQQYIYAKSTQKSKKCIRCGYTHQLSKLIICGEIINGISNAVELVKKKQNELAVKELGSEPDFRTLGDFRISRKMVSQKRVINFNSNNNYYEKFKQILYNLSETHKSFPYYMIEILGENIGISQLEIKLIVRKLRKQGFLIRNNGDYTYSIKE